MSSISSVPALNNLDLSNQISVVVARKTLDAQQEQGDAAIQLLKAAAENESADVRGTSGDGSRGVDVYA
jgi:hypothetical protein